MKNTLNKMIGLMALGILMVAMSVNTQTFAQQAEKGEESAGVLPAGKGARALEGSWNALVTFTDCVTGLPIRAPFPAMHTYMQGGTLHEFGIGSAPLTRGPGHGTWEYVGEGAFTSVLRWFRFNADGSYAGYNIARRQTQVGGDAMSYFATSAVEIYNPAGVQVGAGCATEAATRAQ